VGALRFNTTLSALEEGSLRTRRISRKGYALDPPGSRIVSHVSSERRNTTKKVNEKTILENFAFL